MLTLLDQSKHQESAEHFHKIKLFNWFIGLCVCVCDVCYSSHTEFRWGLFYFKFEKKKHSMLSMKVSTFITITGKRNIRYFDSCIFRYDQSFQKNLKCSIESKKGKGLATLITINTFDFFFVQRCNIIISTRRRVWRRRKKKRNSFVSFLATERKLMTNSME